MSLYSTDGHSQLARLLRRGARQAEQYNSEAESSLREYSPEILSCLLFQLRYGSRSRWNSCAQESQFLVLPSDAPLAYPQTETSQSSELPPWTVSVSLI